MRVKLAILNVLAKRPGGRATIDEIRREVGIIIASADQIEQLKRFSALGDIDIFQSGLVSQDDAGLQITDAGQSLLRSLEDSSGPSPKISLAPESQAFRLIDSLIGTEERLRIFDLELRALDSSAEGSAPQSAQEKENGSVTIGTPDPTSEASAVDLLERTDPQTPDETGDGNLGQPPLDGSDRTIATPDIVSQSAPAFLRQSFGSKVQGSSRKSSQTSNLFVFITTQIRSIPGLWRRHLAQGVSNPKTERLVGGVGGVAFAFLSLLVVVTCVGAAIALGQIKSLKSDIAMLHRELLPLKERLGKLEQADKTKSDGDQQEEAQDKPDSDKNKPGGETRIDQTALNLSREEIQLVRDYIKPAPSAGMAVPAINVGDPIGGAMIPLPSPLTVKVPKLIGARFTTRNGAIIISTKGSRRADAVLAPN